MNRRGRKEGEMKANSNIPGFSAEAALYQPKGRYHMTWSAARLGGPIVAPNFSGSCSFWQTLGCAGALALCAVDCAVDPMKWDCLACFAGLGASSCWNCLPDTGGGVGGGGGGGGGGGCPPGQIECGGSCCQRGEHCRLCPPIQPGGKPIHVCCKPGEDCCNF
jgi:hypothetical protein